MVQYLTQYNLSDEATSVLNAGRELWKKYFSETDVRDIRDLLKLNRADVGWYQVRKALASRPDDTNEIKNGFAEYLLQYKLLEDKIRPQITELGFLR